MPTRAEAPRPSRKPSENVNAPGGTSNATDGWKYSAPLTITASVVTNVPIHSVTVRRPTDSMRR